MNSSFCILYGHVVITFGKEKHYWWWSALHEYFLVYYFLFILGLQIIIIHFFLIIYIKFKIKIWLHSDEIRFLLQLSADENEE